MEKLSNLTPVMVIALLLLFSLSFEVSDARGGSRQWRSSRSTLTNSSINNKSKKHGSKSHHHHSNGGSKHPTSPFHKTPPLLPPPSPNPIKAAPQRKNPPDPPHKGPKSGSFATFNVLDFGAQGDGSTDDTKVTLFQVQFVLV